MQSVQPSRRSVPGRQRKNSLRVGKVDGEVILRDQNQQSGPSQVSDTHRGFIARHEGYPLSQAGISADHAFRYWLFRVWDYDKPVIIWVMMNPSTATHLSNDATISKVINYCRKWGYGAVIVLNIYAVRSTLQREIRGRVGPRNDWWIRTMFEYARRKDIKVVCAWGVKHKDRGDEVRKLAAVAQVKLWCLRSSKKGEPCHPLYLSGELVPRPL